MKIRPKIVDFRSFCVELWPKQVLHRISVPMSYISVWGYPAGGFWAIKSYFEPEKRPAGAFWAHKIVFLCLDNGGLKKLLVDLVRIFFLTDQTNLQKEIQGGRKIC